MSSVNLWTVFTRVNIIRLQISPSNMCVLACMGCRVFSNGMADLWLIVVERPWSILPFGKVL